MKIEHVVHELWTFLITDLDRPAKPHHRFAYQRLDNVKMYRYAKFDQSYTMWFKCCEHLMTTCWTGAWQSFYHRFAYQCLDNVKIYKYANFDQNISLGSRVMSIFTQIPWPAKWCLAKPELPRHCFVYEGCSNMNASSFITFLTYMLRQNVIPFWKELFVAFKMAPNRKKRSL